ncbi:phytanoyl-CoA dioxygenase family protein [Aestuariicella hydrocarbonica]|uniref:Phytanoyl-CoA dioxygenase family protein n=1 Tax=Pseudomaricurvus hydrocarbonicus TaxID=1470433 RepID=A0A9E5MJT5_9GAMM|nr:phytanoyl-CoA dioxygenase family protein [Aestuariicella hydrocarbonica]NHO64447.1 phytanoyl-CoA dioxygenase family protein [Aestuariicella hydrocarbonica]
MSNSKEIRTNLSEKNSFSERFHRDGFLIVEGAFNDEQMKLIEAAYQGNLDNPSALTQHLYAESGGTFIQSVEDSSSKPAFKTMFEQTPIVEICKKAFGSGDVWYFHDQLFYKDGGEKPVRRTPWHQDTPYHAMDGSKFVVFWIPMHDIPEESALEIVRGSHKQTLYNPSFFDPSDDTLPLYDEKEMPRLPEIEAERDKWDIMPCGMKRGDLLIFHPSCLHGGGPSPAGSTRRSLSLRMIGDDMVRVTRPGANLDSPTAKNVGDDEEELTARINSLPLGSPVYEAGLAKLS